MAKTTEQRKKMYNWLIRPVENTPVTDSRTLTVPMENLTLRQIKERYTNGTPISGIGKGEMFYDDGNSNGINPLTMDFNDIQALEQETFKKVEYLTGKVNEMQARRAKQIQEQTALKKAQFREEMEAFMREREGMK